MILYVKNFYSSLYKRRSSESGKDCLEYLKTIDIPKLTENERDSCEVILNKKEMLGCGSVREK